MIHWAIPEKIQTGGVEDMEYTISHTVSTTRNETLMVGKLQHSMFILNPWKNQAFLTISILKFSFISSSMFVLLSENMSP